MWKILFCEPPLEKIFTVYAVLQSAFANRLERAIPKPSVLFQQIVACYCETTGDSLHAATLRMRRARKLQGNTRQSAISL